MRDGDSEFDCLAILDALYKPPQGGTSVSERSDTWRLLWNDLLYKSRPLDENTRKRILSAGLAARLPREFIQAGWRPVVEETNASETKYNADVMIFCVIEEEFNATLAAFGINQRRKKYTTTITGHKFYRLSIQSKHCGDLVLWIGLIGEARNVVCANFCRDIFEKFTVKYFCALVGIAGGNQDKVDICDVVAGQVVIDIEGARVEPKVSKPRHKPFPVSKKIRPLLVGFAPHRWRWLKDRAKGLDILKQTGVQISKADSRRTPKYKIGTILSGEKLRRDGKLPAMARRFGEDILAVEMEGSGFAQACDEKFIDWLIFRGVADFGDGNKSDVWQALAAFNASLAAKAFIVNELRPVADVPF